MRITINLNEEILARVDEEARRIGTSRGAMLTTWVGEKIRAIDNTEAMLKQLTDARTIQQMTDLLKQREDELREVQPSLFDIKGGES